MMVFVDGHAHLDNKAFRDDVARCLARARERDVRAVVNGSSDRNTAQRALDLARENEGMWSTVGVHPHKAEQYLDDSFDWVRSLAEEPEVLAVGEMGLDYHYDFSPRAQQRQVFENMIDLAVELSMPAVVHSREAEADTFVMLENFPPDHRVLLHCFSGDVMLMEEAMDQGYYISLGGVVTFNNANATREVARNVPLDRLLLETDAPYLTPHPHRGKRNEPAYIPLIAEEIARLRGIDVAEVARETTAAAEAFYGTKLV
ncbi:MAG: TatD family hydrolase [Bacillota bacterium]